MKDLSEKMVLTETRTKFRVILHIVPVVPMNNNELECTISFLHTNLRTCILYEPFESRIDGLCSQGILVYISHHATKNGGKRKMLLFKLRYDSNNFPSVKDTYYGIILHLYNKVKRFQTPKQTADQQSKILHLKSQESCK